MNQFLIATHSILAEGLVHAVHFFNSEATNVHYLNAYVEDNEFEKRCAPSWMKFLTATLLF